MTVQPVTIDGGLDGEGSWGIARSIRRRAPWNVDWLRHPMATFFRAERAGTGVDLYVIDTGIATGHDELGGRATNVYEFASSGGLGDDNGHGTAIASCAAGATVGLARGALVFGFKCSTSNGGGSTAESVAAAAAEVIDHYEGRAGTDRPAVVCLAVVPEISAASAVGDMIDAGLVVAVPAGNLMEELSGGSHPLAFADDAIVVGGIGMADIPYYEHPGRGTNFGSRVDLVAPSQGLRVAAAPVLSVGDFYVHGGGTSLGTPLTAGVVACMLEGHARLTSRSQVQTVKAKLLANATTGRLRSAFGLTPLPDRILYLDPDAAFESFD